ncbi:MAG TPA: hypothetical protein VKG78_05570 [Opitutaceae bacterium]|nr:hypothetical protein [Opitutaceae bacterium]
MKKKTIQSNMNASILPVVAFLAAIAASVVLPVGATCASVLLSVTGMLSVMAADYGRKIGPVRAGSRVVPFRDPGCARAALREAA